MEVHCAKMVDYTKQVNDTGSIQLATLPKSGLTKKIWPNGENTQKSCLSFHVSFVFLLLMLLLDGKQFNKYLYFGRSLYCFILTFYNIEAVEDFLGPSQTEVKKITRLVIVFGGHEVLLQNY